MKKKNQNSKAFRRKQRKKRQRTLKSRAKVLSIREENRAEEREKKEIWKIKREGEKEVNRLTRMIQSSGGDTE